ncbi:Bola-like protein [Phytophthora palmivora]|uniref:Bola-like protein n=1 Tax=Phytophthora palmivora TaxID=4796 RepID=A0A2P4XI06_9STRA|nr:Bola-like protein [Phytophthora palmivora]POM65896.1 Bola-like protein [Phytophthora palmivora]
MAVVTPAQLETKIRREIGAALVEAVDLSDGCGSKFSLVVVHEGFEGQSLLERQRRVNDCLKEEMTHIHALQMKTWTPAQYEQKTQKTLPNSQSSGEQ